MGAVNPATSLCLREVTPRKACAVLCWYRRLFRYIGGIFVVVIYRLSLNSGDFSLYWIKRNYTNKVGTAFQADAHGWYTKIVIIGLLWCMDQLMVYGTLYFLNVLLAPNCNTIYTHALNTIHSGLAKCFPLKRENFGDQIVKSCLDNVNSYSGTATSLCWNCSQNITHYMACQKVITAWYVALISWNICTINPVLDIS